MKTCSDCKNEKGLNEFYKEKKGAQGVKGKCKECVEKVKACYKQQNADKVKQSYKRYQDRTRDRQLEYRVEHREELKAKAAVYRKQNIEEIKISGAVYRKQNREKIRISGAVNRKQNREKIRISGAVNRKQNREKIRISRAVYRKTNTERRRKYERDRYKTDVQYRLRRILRSRLRDSLKSFTKFASAIALVGCSISELKSHLENLFTAGMTWFNAGSGKFQWSVDHRIPLSSFDMTDVEEQKKAFHYTNLQPLWSPDNLEKSAKLDWTPQIDLADEMLTGLQRLFGELGVNRLVEKC